MSQNNTHVFDKFDLIKSLGEGAFAKVFQMKGKHDDKNYAVKWISCKTKQCGDYAKREIEILQECNSEGIVRYFGHHEELRPGKNWKEMNSIGLEKLCSERDDLKDYIENNRKFTEFDHETPASCEYTYIVTKYRPTLKDWLIENNKSFDPMSLQIRKKWLREILSLTPRGYGGNLSVRDFLIDVDWNSQRKLKIDSVYFCYMPCGYDTPGLQFAVLAAEILFNFPNNTVRKKVLKKVSEKKIPDLIKNDLKVVEFFNNIFETDTRNIGDLLNSEYLHDSPDICLSSFFANTSVFTKTLPSAYEISVIEDETHSIRNDLTAGFKKFDKYNGKIVQNYTFIKFLPKNYQGVIFLVKCRQDNQIYQIRRVSTLESKEHFSPLSEKQYSHFSDVKEVWVEQSPKKWVSLYGFINRRIEKIVSIKMLLAKYLLPNEAINVIDNIDENVNQPEKPRNKFNSEFFIVMEVGNGTLESWLNHETNFSNRPINKMKEWIKQISETIAYIHGKNIMHRDLKPANIFFKQSKDEFPPILIGDFGLARYLDEINNKNVKSPRRKSGALTNDIGTDSYMSPEQRDNQLYSLKIDIFALGLIATELIIPFQTTMERLEVFEDLRAGRYPKIFDEYEEAAEFLLLLTSKNPDDRPNADQVLAHPFIIDCE